MQTDIFQMKALWRPLSALRGKRVSETKTFEEVAVPFSQGQQFREQTVETLGRNSLRGEFDVLYRSKGDSLFAVRTGSCPACFFQLLPTQPLPREALSENKRPGSASPSHLFHALVSVCLSHWLCPLPATLCHHWSAPHSPFPVQYPQPLSAWAMGWGS